MRSLYFVWRERGRGGGDGGRGMVVGSVSSGVVVSRDADADGKSEMFGGTVDVGRTVETSEEGFEEELRTESRDVMCRRIGLESRPTSGALTRTGVRRGRMGDSTRVIAVGFERSSFVTMSAIIGGSRSAAVLFVELGGLGLFALLTTALNPSLELCAESLRNPVAMEDIIFMGICNVM